MSRYNDQQKQGMSALKLILIIALGIIMAGFIGCVGSMVFTGAVITGMADAMKETTTNYQKTTEENKRRLLENQQRALESQRQALEAQKQMNNFVATQKQIQRHRPADQPTQGYIEINGKRIAIPKHEPQAKLPELTRDDLIEYRKKTGQY